MNNAFIPLFTPDIRESDIAAVSEVLRTGMLVQGKQVELLEAAFCEITGAKHAVAVSNGTATLHLILHALGICNGDEVIVPAFSYVATANVVELVGAKPIFVDVDLSTFNINIDAVESKITPNTRAIMPVHEFGLSANLEPLRKLAEKHNLFLIEDAACAIGSDFMNISTGKNSFAASFSLHPRKAITSGEGGIVVTNNPDLAAQLRILRNHGISMVNGEMDFVEAGFNYRMTDFQAALVLAQTSRLFEQINHKRKIAEIYLKNLDTNFLKLPEIPNYANHTWQTFHVVLNSNINRKEVIQLLKEAGIGANYGAQCIPATTFYTEVYQLNSAVEFPNALNAFQHGLALPMFPGITEEQAYFVTEKLNSILKNKHGK
ncbi:MAG: DegT/DnrJ/EryC1/StrS family aminotransferase [Bacteroidia bacterium]|nr:DegT/DnrJ/EryC1/StrS family aminotransferase [Bacteroidia bacterium]